MPRSADASCAELEIRILGRQQQGYPVEPTLDGQRSFARGFLDPTVLPWVPSDDPAADGERLFTWLFGVETLKDAWAKASGVDRRCRLRLRIDESAAELQAVPWELLRQPASAGTPALDLAADSKTPFSRYLALGAAPGRPIVAQRLKVLVAVADPANLPDYRSVAINRRQELVALRAATAALPVDLVPLDGPCTLAALEAALRQGCHVLHIISHGVYHARKGAALYLANENNQVQPAAAKDLVDMVAHQFTEENPLRLIFLASCQTATTSPPAAFRGLAPQLLQVGVPAVLAMQDLVPIPAARKFAQDFYRQLVHHGQVDLAANEARASLLPARLPGAAIPILFMRVPDGRLYSIGTQPGAHWVRVLVRHHHSQVGNRNPGISKTQDTRVVP
jgi:hypothetical protein